MSAAAPAPFHLAFPVDDLAAAEAFYAGRLGLRIGRRSERWIDFDIAGHQITAHLVGGAAQNPGRSEVDGDRVPVRHFGLVLAWDDWQGLVAHLRAEGQTFLIEPRIRFEGQPGEQATCFVRDPAGNALEFKSFRDPSRLFAT
ncbi:MAG: VOC family protein [Planctomycetota bacterium]